jgi:transposase InsO family protein
MGSRGDAYDNAACESCIGTLKVEWINRHRYVGRDQARLSIFTYVETFTTLRRHTSLGGSAPTSTRDVFRKANNQFEFDTIQTTKAA